MLQLYSMTYFYFEGYVAIHKIQMIYVKQKPKSGFGILHTTYVYYRQMWWERTHRFPPIAYVALK